MTEPILSRAFVINFYNNFPIIFLIYTVYAVGQIMNFLSAHLTESRKPPAWLQKVISSGRDLQLCRL